MSDTRITLDVPGELLMALDDWRSKNQHSLSREATILSILEKWAKEKTGPTMHIADEGTRPEELNASNDD